VTPDSNRKESTANNPVFMPQNQVNDTNLKVGNVKQVWGNQPASGGQTQKPADSSVTSNYDVNKVKITKKEPPKP
jgi:hypothetical protein